MLHTPMMTHWCRQAGLPHRDVDDVTQEVFAAVAASLATFRADGARGTFRSWLRGSRVTRSRTTFAARSRPPRGGPMPSGGSRRSPAAARVRSLRGGRRGRRSVSASLELGAAPVRGTDLDGVLAGCRRGPNAGGGRRRAGNHAQRRPPGQVARAPPAQGRDGRCHRMTRLEKGILPE